MVLAIKRASKVRTYTARPRPDVRFPDGRAVDAADVKYTYDSVCDPLVGSRYRQHCPLELSIVQARHGMGGAAVPDGGTILHHVAHGGTAS